ncbi:hypothetical protein KJZ71_03490 [Patescibacteria group bacterium]|uniref:Uncharacterized protein n=1 Tax=candidate division WWE3 bacterium TaxID=2053526 RepID=A0A928Y663_UNCKA|nr:hypothetical protein [Anaerolineales bacterium]MBE7525202.1 hypothetical protein [candidate division WWE3 bacterium]MCL4732836.1 hypothetical protein [Patescibacteria group bacterium]MDL1953016.1 hypothetical protein [Candidatus Uhrbacteria bacterium UHB]RIL00196.1 MAG: hypothetical protein DCC77_04910 [Candidatus Uhrbacteria bacterium]
MHRLRHLWCVLLSGFLAVLFFAARVSAQGNPPVEGVNFKVIHPRDGNPEWTYFMILPHKNVNTHKLAEIFRTDQWSIREDNPTGTLAVCETRPGHFDMSRGIKDPEGRRTNAVWANCPKEKQYVYMLYSTVLVLKGKKHLSFDEKQQVLSTLESCTDRTCLLETASRVSGKDALAHPGSGIGNTVVAPPPDKPAAIQPPPPPAPPPPALAIVKTEGTGDGPFWGAIVLALIGLVVAVRERSRAMRFQRYSTAFPKIEAQSAHLSSECSDLQDAIRNAVLKLNKSVLGNGPLPGVRQDPKKLLSVIADRVVERFYGVHGALGELARNVNGGQVSLSAALEPSDIARINERVTVLKSSRTAAVAQEVETKLRLEEISAVHERQKQERSFKDFLAELYVRFRGAPPDGYQERPADELERDVLRLVETADESYRRGIDEVRQVIGLPAIDQAQACFDAGALEDIHEALEEKRMLLESLAASSETELTTLSERIDFVSSDSTLERFRRRCEELAEKLFHLKASAKPAETPTGQEQRTASEDIERLVTEHAALEIRLAELEGQNAGLRIRLYEAERQPTTNRMPTFHDIQVGGEKPASAEIESIGLEPAKSGRTMTPPAVGTISTLDTRSPKRRAAFSGIHAFADIVEGHVTFRLEHDSELPIIRRLAQLLNRNFQWESAKGETHTFKPGKLLNEQYWAAIAG